VPFDPKQVLEKLRSGNIKKTLGNRADQARASFPLHHVFYRCDVIA
jgi:hypothetical protein